MEMTLTKAEIHILMHSLGLQYGPDGFPKPYRNRYCAPVGDTELEALVKKGLMARGQEINIGESQMYWVTAEGKDWLGLPPNAGDE